MEPKTSKQAKTVAFWLQEHTISLKLTPSTGDSMPRSLQMLPPVRMGHLQMVTKGDQNIVCIARS